MGDAVAGKSPKSGFKSLVLLPLARFARRRETPWELLIGGLLAALLLWYNAAHGSERLWIGNDPNPTARLLKYLALYGISFGSPYLLFWVAFKGARQKLANPKLWSGILVAVVLFSVRAWFYQYNQWVDQHIPFGYRLAVSKLIINAAGPVLLGLPVLLFWRLSGDSRRMPPYGFKRSNVVPYLLLLAGMLPLLLWAAQQSDFQQTYPRAEKLFLPAAGKYNAPITGVYEMLYSLDFVITEFFFRGFLILHFMRFVGARAVIPMCVFYVVIHFDKPLAEAISSFFGGLVLGILVLESRSVWGGIIVHLGIALLMEIMGFLF